MEKKNVIFLSVIAVATLLTAVVGTTFAYFTATVTGNETSKNVNVTTANMSVVYTQGDKVSIANLVPGQEIPAMTFNVKNSGQSAVDYKLAWQDVNKSWTAESLATNGKGGADTDIQYTISACDETYTSCNTVIHASSVLPNADGDITTADTLTLAAGATAYYKVQVVFTDNKTAAQDALQGQTFGGTVVVSAAVQSGHLK